MSLSQWPAGEAPREKLLLRGSHALSDAEVLSLLLGTGSRGCDVLTLSRHLLARFGSLGGVIAAPWDELSAQPGVGPAKFASLQAALELARRQAREGLERGDTMGSPQQTQQFLSLHLQSNQREVFCCLFLDSQNALIRCEDLFTGTLDGAAVYPREVVRRALQLNAAAVILAHNHPSGVAEPSQADRRITERLQAALALLDIRVLDHIIVGTGQIYSFAERGLL
jgi:DNA repair protein RadC